MKLLSPPNGFFVESSRRLPYLDLLRTLAITFVMVRHFIEFTPDYLHMARENDWEFWRFGITGVDLFFVISGFLIFSMLFRLQQTNRLVIKDFFVGRILRIWPAYFVSIFVIAVFSSFDSLTHIPVFLLFLQNYVLLSPNVNGGIYWTLAVEEHFYLFAPLLVILLSRPNRYRTAAYFAMLLCLPVAFRFASFFYGQVDLTTLTRQSHYRIDTIMCGVGEWPDHTESYRRHPCLETFELDRRDQMIARDAGESPEREKHCVIRAWNWLRGSRAAEIGIVS